VVATAGVTSSSVEVSSTTKSNRNFTFLFYLKGQRISSASVSERPAESLQIMHDNKKMSSQHLS
jgi:hypothetical protein